jgi:hypothetical protein
VTRLFDLIQAIGGGVPIKQHKNSIQQLNGPVFLANGICIRSVKLNFHLETNFYWL